MGYADIAPMMRKLWSPLAAVTTHSSGRDNVQMAVSISAASIVPDRPRVLVQLYKTNLTHQMVTASRCFALNFLNTTQLDLVGDFGLISGRDKDKLQFIDKMPGELGSPLLTDCFGYLDCRVVSAMDGGDMTCFLAEVIDGKTMSEGQPLWWRDAKREMSVDWLERWEEKQSSEIAISRVTMDKIDLFS